ncbi:MAG: FAD/NAD(P)-binding protein [gamma proteobacterium endosymbiont of Lamellibrachia anaximandri]|nr:FAD/NAD(P)-binding protein [gamma proteobacterium endosymbiont of Lamellibrachia anaximandri]MBL3535567.1 FAD/NAD(P)-binding protein [gamma proteobacterium endosymbiont of Lamellibrachia anaximandri]
MLDAHLPHAAVIDRRVQESPGIFSLRLQYVDTHVQDIFEFQPGQFNMLSLFGVGEVPISIVSDPDDSHFFDHTIRVVGRVTEALSRLQPGDRVGIRGPFGRGWPMAQAEGQDVVVVTGGLGCAPLVSVIRYLLRRRDRFGDIHIMQGVKHEDDLIWRRQYEVWSREQGVNVQLAADMPGKEWPWQQGLVTELINTLDLNLEKTISMLCGPELMMLAAIAQLRDLKLDDQRIWLSMERNMQCGFGQCGHCQVGPKFVCKDGPVFCYSDVADFLGAKGF